MCVWRRTLHGPEHTAALTSHRTRSVAITTYDGPCCCHPFRDSVLWCCVCVCVTQLRAISTGKASQVKACHAMRGALELLDFEDASINDMKRMLLQVWVLV